MLSENVEKVLLSGGRINNVLWKNRVLTISWTVFQDINPINMDPQLNTVEYLIGIN